MMAVGGSFNKLRPFIERLDALRMDAVVGMALYSGKISP